MKQRLLAIADRVPEGAAVADIGCDHAHLAVHLIKSGRAQKVIACDIRKGPLETARKNVAASGAHNIELRLGDGLVPLAPNEVDTVVIAGMGGEVMADIIAAAPWVKENKTLLLLQPMVSAEEVRHYLSADGFSVKEEFTVVDTGRVYVVIAAVFTGKTGEYTEWEEYIGHLNGANPDEVRYISRQYLRLVRCANDIENIPRKRAEYEKARRCSEKIGQLLDELGGRPDEG